MVGAQQANQLSAPPHRPGLDAVREFPQWRAVCYVRAAMSAAHAAGISKKNPGDRPGGLQITFHPKG
jgi:hypothetical protein